MSAPGQEGCNWQGIPGDRRDYARLGACNVYGHERGWVAQGPQDGDAPCQRTVCDGENTDATRWLIHPWKYDRCTDEYTKIMRGLGDSSELDETAAVTTRQRTRMRIINMMS